MSDTPELLAAVGHALYGSRWVTDMSDELGINRRTITRWLRGDYEPQPGVWGELCCVLRERQAALPRLIATLEDRDSTEG
jgi:DNA-binding XRE family transcriptional regulator